MPYKVTLRKGEQTEDVIVKEARLLTGDIQTLDHFDPYMCPDDMEDDIVFVSKNLSAMIMQNSDVEVEKITPTDEPLPEIEPVF